MPHYTRRRLLARVAPALALAAILPACGEPDKRGSTVTIGQRDCPLGGTPSPATPRPLATPSGIPMQRTVVATPTSATHTPTRAVATSVYQGDDLHSCPSYGFRTDVQPDDPYVGGSIGEREAVSFAEKVKESADLIILGTVRDILPARWVTPDGSRPANPHGTDEYMLVFTPVRVGVELVAKGTYSLPDIYIAAPGGRIGQDCASYYGSGAYPLFRFGGRFLYFINPYRINQYRRALPAPVPADDRYRYFDADYSYTVEPDGTVTIGPEWDIMGGRVDDPPRRLTVGETLREIAALLASPSGTPTR